MMHEFVRRFDRQPGQQDQLSADLASFPGRFRVYGVDRSPTSERYYVEFHTMDQDAANEFLENLLT